ncbi:MAG: DinB family protein [Terracidiphilus sp.]
MSSLNPYEKYLDGRPLEAILSSTTEQLGALIAAIGPEKSAVRPAPGKWSPAEILCHLADCELVFGFRLRQTLAEDTPTVQPFDQEKWADTYPAIGAEQALATFSAFRKWNLLLLAAALPAAANRPVIHPERGQMTFQTIVGTMAGHDLNHLAQLQTLAASATS